MANSKKKISSNVVYDRKKKIVTSNKKKNVQKKEVLDKKQVPLTQKERNKKNYEARQKKYKENVQSKKKNVVSLEKLNKIDKIENKNIKRVTKKPSSKKKKEEAQIIEKELKEKVSQKRFFKIFKKKEEEKKAQEEPKKKFWDKLKKKKDKSKEKENELTSAESGKIKPKKKFLALFTRKKVNDKTPIDIKEEIKPDKNVDIDEHKLSTTVNNIKKISQDRIRVVKEKTSDKNIPVGKNKEEKKQRIKRYLKEAFLYAMIISLINIVACFVFDDVNFLRLFDVKLLNIAVTFLLSLLFSYIMAFLVDYLVTELWIKKKAKEGEQNGDNRIIEGKYSKDIQKKKGK